MQGGRLLLRQGTARQEPLPTQRKIRRPLTPALSPAYRGEGEIHTGKASGTQKYGSAGAITFLIGEDYRPAWNRRPSVPLRLLPRPSPRRTGAKENTHWQSQWHTEGEMLRRKIRRPGFLSVIIGVHPWLNSFFLLLPHPDIARSPLPLLLCATWVRAIRTERFRFWDDLC